MHRGGDGGAALKIIRVGHTRSLVFLCCFKSSTESLQTFWPLQDSTRSEAKIIALLDYNMLHKWYSIYQQNNLSL